MFCRKFKRIRKTTSVSDSDDNGTPIKRKFVRDDLTVEFMDTENVMKNVHSQQNCSSSESEKMDYDVRNVFALLFFIAYRD